MKIIFGQGNYFDGKFSNSGDIEITSHNPALNYQTIYQTKTAINQVNDAVTSAKKALPAWRALNQEERNKVLLSLKTIFIKNEAKIAQAISLEMGKIYSESLTEAKNLSARIDLTIKDGLKRVATEKPNGILGETRYHSQGVLAVLGPYNFPAHLVNAHVIPALLTGNTVVVKFSEVCPWVGELYAECVHESDLPAGVFNMVQGKADIGQTLAKHPEVRGILFTGSYATGRKLKEATLDEPNKILALEMGGKNIAVVLKDAHLFQALSEIIQGAFLTTGQRCTATSRVLVDKFIAQKFIHTLSEVTKQLNPGSPFSSETLFGPLANKNALDNYWSILQKIPTEVETLVSGKLLGGGAFVTPSLHLLKNKKAPGYIDTELFGPDICVEIIEGIDEAISITNESPYGLSNALFTKNQNAFEQFYQETYSGVLNLNRSTNGAYGSQPFGGLGKSGNQRAAGIDAVRYTTYPVAVNHLAFGETTVDSNLTNIISPEQSKLKISLETLTARHKIESLLESLNIPFDEADNNFIKMPIKFLNLLKLNHEKLSENVLLNNLEPYAQIDFTHLTLTISENKSAEFCNTCETFFLTLYNENYLELANIYADKINIPDSPILPRSQAMLDRLYRNDFVPKEKKTAVINLNASSGAYLASIDDDPLVLFDAASQIASIGTGFQADTFLNALTEGDLTSSLLANLPESSTAKEWINKYTHLLLKHTNEQIKYATFTSSGAEANEKALDLCRLNGPGGTKIIAFEGSFHGRTIMSLQATYNPTKRKQFEFSGYEASFVPFPKYFTPNEQPEIPEDWVSNWSAGKKYPNISDDTLLNSEISSLNAVDDEIKKGNICAVIIEPMQCEGGDNYATARFFNGLRALTRHHKVPLIFDEVQTGFGLLGPFYAHTSFTLKDANNKSDSPDCITLAKKAQLGVCLSKWEDTRPFSPHVIQVIRGFLQAEAMLNHQEQGKSIEKVLTKQLLQLQNSFPDLVSNPRCKNYAMAFDLPNNHLAMQLINQRFYRGMMVYIAGDNTIRFRFNLKTNNSELKNFDNQL
ncbi:MAG: aldehyde dehydrogenase family protein, partial [bacterium]|nr:aldehyde dehydrogenase family protein [bacterium]